MDGRSIRHCSIADPPSPSLCPQAVDPEPEPASGPCTAVHTWILMPATFASSPMAPADANPLFGHSVGVSIAAAGWLWTVNVCTGSCKTAHGFISYVDLGSWGSGLGSQRRGEWRACGGGGERAMECRQESFPQKISNMSGRSDDTACFTLLRDAPSTPPTMPAATSSSTTSTSFSPDPARL